MSEQFSQEEELSQESESDPFEVTDVDERVRDENETSEPEPVAQDVETEPEVERDQGSEVEDETEPEPEPRAGGAPETGDLVIDAALRDLAEAPTDDLDAQIERGEQVQRTLQGRLSDLGG